MPSPAASITRIPPSWPPGTSCFSWVGKEEKTAFLVNHHPSKYGGAALSEARRELAVRRLAFLADSLRRSGTDRIVAMGDFNDTPANPLYKLLEPGLRNLAEPQHRQGKGTIKYEGA